MDEYESFDEYLEIDFEDTELDEQIHTLDELRRLMKNYGYNIQEGADGKRHKEMPTNKQTVYAWDRLKLQGNLYVRKNKEYRLTVSNRFQALKDTPVYDKENKTIRIYRKGWFIPKKLVKK